MGCSKLDVVLYGTLAKGVRRTNPKVKKTRLDEIERERVGMSPTPRTRVVGFQPSTARVLPPLPLLDFGLRGRNEQPPPPSFSPVQSVQSCSPLV